MFSTVMKIVLSSVENVVEEGKVQQKDPNWGAILSTVKDQLPDIDSDSEVTTILFITSIILVKCIQVFFLEIYYICVVNV